MGVALVLLLAATASGWAQQTARQIIAAAIVEEDDAKKLEIIGTLVGQADPIIPTLLGAWKEDLIFVYKGEADTDPKIPVLLTDEKDAEEKQAAVRIDDAQPLKDAAGAPLRIIGADYDTAVHDSAIRGAMKAVLDMLALADPAPAKRTQAINTFGFSQEQEKLLPLITLQAKEKDAKVKHALREAIALIQLRDEDPNVQIAACQELGRLGSIPSQDFLKALIREQKAKLQDAEGKMQDAEPKMQDAGSRMQDGSAPAGPADVARAAEQALADVAAHLRNVNIAGTAFRGLSAGSILLVVALGLAITFGLMGVINMAHGEIMVVGAYATYLVQNFFGTGINIAPFGFRISIPGLSPEGVVSDWYFVVALPVAFLSAALVGIALERGIIRFLYRRPLESLLATWGVSLVLQQLFKLTFGANNVQVYSPSYLSGNWTVNDVSFTWNRLFVIGFAILIVWGTHLILTRTPLGLLIRAVMQNRQMAACMGVRTDRVNMFTFGLGSGLAGLAGAFLSQIGNVGPNVGQDYIVGCFMTVVVGGVGSIIGTVISALGIGLADQSLQQVLGNPVLGKILVLVGIILFLQWRPAGLFVTKSRSLEG